MSNGKLLDFDGLKLYDQNIKKKINDVAGGANSRLDKLVGADADKSVRTIAAEELASQLIPESADESLNTLQEIADWIQKHPESASEMNSKIQALEAKSHEHGNKDALDSVTGEKISSWDNKAEANHSHDVATVDADGFMSKEDKLKLDGIVGGAKVWGLSDTSDMMPVGLTFSLQNKPNAASPFATWYVGDVSDTNNIKQLPIGDIKPGDYIVLGECVFVSTMTQPVKNVKYPMAIHMIEQVIDDKNIAIGNIPVAVPGEAAGYGDYESIGLAKIAPGNAIKADSGAYVRSSNQGSYGYEKGLFVEFADYEKPGVVYGTEPDDTNHIRVDHGYISIDSACNLVKDGFYEGAIDFKTIVLDDNKRIKVNTITEDEINALFSDV